jgi:tRNA A37 threonylcarbamoyltransferase TsaD
LQALMRERARERGIELCLAPRELRTDNAAMIAYAAALHFAAGASSPLDADVRPSFDAAQFERVPEPAGLT